MTTDYIIAPPPRFYTTNNCGRLNVQGFIVTKDALTGAPKPTYRDGAGFIENPTRMPVGADGSPGFPVFWKIVSGQPLYRIEWYDLSGALIGIDYNFPKVSSSSGGDVVVNTDAVNLGLNEQFIFWSEGTTFDNAALPVGSTEIADKWLFTRSNTTADIEISRYVFSPADNLVPFSPPYALLYRVNTNSADAVSDISQRYLSVQTLTNQSATVGIYLSMADLTTTAEVELIVNQNFGTGGSAPISTTLTTFTVTDSFQFFEYTFVVPTIAGNTIGTEGDDYLEIVFRMSPAQLQGVILSDYQFQSGNGTGTAYPYVITDEQYVKLLPFNLRSYGINQGTHLIASPAGPDAPQGPSLYNYLETQPQPSYLIGWYFLSNPNQMGTPINSTSVYPSNDGGYIADMTILQSDGDNVVEKISFTGENLLLEVVTGAKKFGIGQIIESSNCQSLFEEKVSAYFIATSTTVTASCKFAIIGWGGTVDQETRQFVAPGAWEAAGTNPTLKPGWDYLSVQEFTIGSDPTTSLGKIDGFLMPDSASYSVFGVFWWIDDLSAATSDVIEFVYANLTKTSIASTMVLAETNEETLMKCQRYFYKSYDATNPNFIFNNVYAAIGITLPNTFSPTGEGSPNPGTEYPAVPYAFAFPYSYDVIGGAQFSAWTGNSYFNFRLPQAMAAVPTVTVYNANDYTSNSIYNYLDYTVGGAPFSIDSDGLSEGPYTLTNIGTQVVTIKIEKAGLIMSHPGTGASYLITFNSNILSLFNIVADAQLGV